MNDPTPEVAHVLVLGAGAMGSLFGATLAQGGLAVMLVDIRTDHIDAINAKGVRIQGYGGERTVRVPATTCAGELPRADIVLVQTKAPDTAAAVESVRRVFGPETVAISFQNGLGNEEVIGGLVGPERVLAGLTAQGATLVGPGVVHNYGDLPTYVGELEGGSSVRAERIAKLFTAAGLRTHASTDIRRDMWKKLLGNVGLSPTSAITNLTSVEIMSVPELREVVLGAVDEAAVVGSAEGIELDAGEARSVLLKLADPSGGGTGQSRSSACTDILNRRRTEVDWINGAIVRLGEKHGIATLINRTLVGAVKGLEKHFPLPAAPSVPVSVLYLVRHGQSEWNRIGRIQGRSESPLTGRGREQAAALGRMLRTVLPDSGIDIVASPLGRACETATIIAGELGRAASEVSTDERINDFDIGELAGYPGWDAVADDHPQLARLRLEDPIHFQPPGGESGADVLARARDFLTAREIAGRDTLVVGHGVINKFIRAAARGITGGDIIALGEDQDVVYRLDGATETELRARRDTLAHGDALHGRPGRWLGRNRVEGSPGDRDSSSERRTVRVDLAERGYDIVIGARLLETAADMLAPIVAGRRVVVVTDGVVRSAHLPRLAPALDRLGVRWDTVTIPTGEGAKSFREIETLLHRLLDLGVDRSTVLVAFGGGVVGDVAGFAAALFMRGIDLVQIPTTLMSQVDSAVGGKNAVNTRHGKNLVGTFHQPRLVLNDVSVLESLPRRELLSGYGEIVKCGLIRGEAEFGWLEEHASALLSFDTGPLTEAVRMGCETKADIVAADERDRGDRALVNLGHTFAHAIEAEAGYGALPHGEAVAAGLAAAAALSAKLGHCDPSIVERVRSHLRSSGLPDRIAGLASNRTWDAGAILGHMAHDKKTVGGRIHFVLLRAIGAPFVDGTVPDEAVLDMLDGECRRG